ncbi:copper resistance protein CopD [Paenibacillus psychroresistens]|uniref:Copper resistance protein CopD n=1 Tax=Paenibacillus psychroresistens TaxID=1778678 RepID=A0A6B8RKP4_9BACL|nr:CopD family protein [Paenibacillus psychroresistens]QGQ96609.1 copper resistance protein CopD [Paenibacillus psychroresistens]
MTFVSDAFLYLCFALLIGGLLSLAIPANKQPNVQVPKWVLPLAVVGVAILSFMPVWRIISYFASDLGFWITFKSVLFTFEEGKAFLWTLALSIILLIILTVYDIRNQPTLLVLSLLLTLLMVLALGWSSHVASKYGEVGFLAHTVHFLAVSVWMGLLFVTGWFAKDHRNWLAFLKWYTPLSIICVTAVLFTGWLITQYLAPQYVGSWVLPYGQALLIKHLFIIPLLVFASYNGFFIKRKFQQVPQYNPIPWVRTESVITLCIFTITGYLGQQSPPHDVALTLNENKPSQLFLAFHPNGVDPKKLLLLDFNLTSILLALLACLFLIAGTVFYFKGYRSFLTLIASVCFVITAYISLMLSVN